MKTPVKPAKEGITLSIYVQPGASKSAWAGIHGELLKLRVAARPVEGEANKEVCAYLAKFFRVPKSSVKILHGDTARTKLVWVGGDPSLLMQRSLELVS